MTCNPRSANHIGPPAVKGTDTSGPDEQSLDEVEQLPRLLEVTVPPEYEDLNGHMRITHHLGIHESAWMPFMALLGLDETYFTVDRLGIIDLESHLRYLAEVHVGDRVAVHCRLLARSKKAIHTIWFLVNLSRAEISNTLETISANFNQDLRRTEPFRADVADALDRIIAEHDQVGWQPRLCGVMGIRR